MTLMRTLQAPLSRVEPGQHVNERYEAIERRLEVCAQFSYPVKLGTTVLCKHMAIEDSHTS